MKKRIKFICTLLALTILLSFVGCLFTSASSEEHPSTNVYYMNGYKMFGFSTLMPQFVSSTTHCENLSYQKRVIMYYSYTDLVGTPYIDYAGDTGYVTYGFEEIDITIYADGSRTFDGVLGDHYIVASTHMYWQASESEDYTYLGKMSEYKPD